MRMRQSLAEIERAFHEEAQVEQVRAQHRVRTAELRTRQRQIERQHKHGTMRFIALCVVLLGTAVLVTVAMFQALSLLVG